MKLSSQMRRAGWLCFTIMWIPFATLMIAMIGLPDGDYAWEELPELSRYSLFGVVFLSIASAALLMGAPIVSGLQNRWILSRGRMAKAKIIKIWDTGTTINRNPVVRLLLQVHPPGQPSFQAEAERLIPRLQIPQLQPGATVQVRYDPESRAVALVDEDEEQHSDDG